MATQLGYDRSGAHVGLTESHCRGRSLRYRDTTQFREELEGTSTPLCRSVFPQRRECGANYHKHKFLATRCECAPAKRYVFSSKTAANIRRMKLADPSDRVRRGFVWRLSAQKDGRNRASWPCSESNLLMASVRAWQPHAQVTTIMVTDLELCSQPATCSTASITYGWRSVA